MKLKVILTGATGMVGEGVLNECLRHPDVESVLSVSRKHPLVRHAKLRTLIHDNFYDFSALKDELRGYNACFFCLGVSSIGMSEKDFTRSTYDLTMALAKTLAELDPSIGFCYVSGAGTDSSEEGKSMWARVKGKTENELIRLFPNAHMFRPGYMQPVKGAKNTLKYYKYFSWMYPGLKTIFPSYVCRLEELARAMINAVRKKNVKKILEVKDIVELADSN